MEKAVADVACGKAIVVPKEQVGQVPGLRVSPVGIAEEREKTMNYPQHDFRAIAQRRARRGGVGECDDTLG